MRTRARARAISAKDWKDYECHCTAMCNCMDKFTYCQEYGRRYANMYVAAATALKLVDSALQVGGPASAQPSWVGLLMDYCKNTSVPLDFVSTHAYPAETSSLESQINLGGA